MRSEAGSGDDALAVRVQIIGRAGCHLCDEAEAVVAEVCGQRGVRYEVVSIDDERGGTAHELEAIAIGQHHHVAITLAVPEQIPGCSETNRGVLLKGMRSREGVHCGRSMLQGVDIDAL